ncbi:unnamed protein product [Ixodes persulcatus]
MKRQSLGQPHFLGRIVTTSRSRRVSCLRTTDAERHYEWLSFRLHVTSSHQWPDDVKRTVVPPTRHCCHFSCCVCNRSTSLNCRSKDSSAMQMSQTGLSRVKEECIRNEKEKI